MGQECRNEDQGRGKKRRDTKETKKRQKERDRCFSPPCCGSLFRHQPVCFQKRPVNTHRADQAWKPDRCPLSVGLLPTGGTLTHMNTIMQNLPLQPIPSRTFLTGREKNSENTEMIVLLATTLYEVLLAEESLETPPSLVLSSW